MPAPILTQSRLKELLHYDPETGVFTNRITRNHAAKKGDVAGSQHRCGYRQISLLGQQYLLHRLAFLYMEGYLPKEVDHKNRVRDDNRWENLREVTRQENSKNRSLRSDSGTGVTGAHYYKSRNKWTAHISFSGKTKCLGYFSSMEDAIEARKSAEERLGFSAEHGSESPTRYINR